MKRWTLEQAYEYYETWATGAESGRSFDGFLRHYEQHHLITS
jgi:hypothetical protein